MIILHMLEIYYHKQNNKSHEILNFKVSDLILDSMIKECCV